MLNAKPYHRNPRQIKKGRFDRLNDTLTRLGDLGGIVHNVRTDEIIGGNQRTAVFGQASEVQIIEKYDTPDEQGTVAHGFVVWQGKKYSYRQVYWNEETAAEANIAANIGAGEWDWAILANEWQPAELLEWGFDESLLTNWRLDVASLGNFLESEAAEEIPDERPNPRNLPIDVIYTLQMADCTCCIAVQAGLKYGIQSAHYRLCPYVGQLSGRHLVSFIDNDYFDYNHDTHLKAVKELAPKYTTVRDVMSKEQCAKAGITHYPLEQILEWAWELSEHAENVIVIPKYDCLDLIPDNFILGFSVPTSHGGTVVSPECFKGRRVHLLGGSWKEQLKYMAFFGDDVVSVDNNYILKQAQYGSFVYPDGRTGNLSESLGIDGNNPRYTAIAISAGNIGAKVQELYGGK